MLLGTTRHKNHQQLTKCDVACCPHQSPTYYHHLLACSLYLIVHPEMRSWKSLFRSLPNACGVELNNNLTLNHPPFFFYMTNPNLEGLRYKSSLISLFLGHWAHILHHILYMISKDLERTLDGLKLTIWSSRIYSRSIKCRLTSRWHDGWCYSSQRSREQCLTRSINHARGVR